MKIYTKSGDKGTTGLFSGTRISKADSRLDAYGSLDELNAQVGMLKDLLNTETGNEANSEKQDALKPRLAELGNVQSHLFSIGSHMANDLPDMVGKLPVIHSQWTVDLELAIDTMDQDLTPMKQFILPGGHVVISQAHVCRTVCRRAERHCAALQSKLDAENNPFPGDSMPYINRLSDYFFTLSRWLGKTFDVLDTPWVAK
jgi:cob(I)alamin adenosyltransferase